MKFEIYDGDCIVEINPTQKMKDDVFDAIVAYCKEQDVWSGESLMQCDSPSIEAPQTLSNIIDEIIKPVITEKGE